MPRNGERFGHRAPGAPARQPPPGGTAGAAQQTAATMPLMIAASFGRAPTRFASGNPFATKRRKKRRKSARRISKPRRAGARRSKKRAHLVRGSAAAKRHMAKLRRMQKKRR